MSQLDRMSLTDPTLQNLVDLVMEQLPDDDRYYNTSIVIVSTLFFNGKLRYNVDLETT